MLGKKVLECHSSLCTSEKELLDWRSGVFHQKISLSKRVTDNAVLEQVNTYRMP
jgi:hypothetical protein